MGIELYKHNAIAYNKVKEMFKTEKRACIVHPTGCGKSFIGLKWLEENRDKKAIFLAPTVSILRQITKHIEDSGMSMKDFPNLKRYTYSKLSKMSEKQIADLGVDLIVLDEFHRCGANEWSKGIGQLINIYGDAQVLGFSATPIRYLDEKRDMAEELFHGNIASEITLADALADGILPMPTYINAVYSFEEDINNMQEKINKSKGNAERLQAQQYLDEAKKLLEKADGLPQIFAKHIKNTSGKYIVFCRNKEHMAKMMSEAKEWFKEVNDEVDMYSIASFIPKSDNMRIFDTFYHSDNAHLKLLFSIDMLNEGIHVPNIDGVIMLRPTISPIIYNQQLGRALSVGHNSNPLVFDIVNNVQSCEMISHFYRELVEKALVRFTQDGNQEYQDKIESFKISDTVRQIQDIFNQIDNCLRLSWDDYYNLAVEYYEEHENLLVPVSYIRNGMNLGSWIVDQRKNKKGKGHRRPLTEEQIEKLDAIGMVWDKFQEQWDDTYEIAKAYYERHGNLDVTKGEIIKGKNLRQWLDDQTKAYNKGILSEERLQLLKKIGMVWDKLDTRWQEMYQLAQEYYAMYGTLSAVKNEKLRNWLQVQRQAYRGNKQYTKLTEEQIKKLEQIGMVWDSKEKGFSDMYELAKQYYEENGNLLLPDGYEVNGKKLASWVKDKRKSYSKGTLSEEQIEKLEAIGMVWSVREYEWNQMYEKAKNYYDKHGHLEITPKEDKKLHQWINRQRSLLEGNTLSAEQKELLLLIQIDKKSQKETKPENSQEEIKKVSVKVQTWENMFIEAQNYYDMYGNLLVSKAERTKQLYSWIQTQRKNYKNKSLTQEQIERLETIGMVWDVRQHQWDTMYAQAKAYYETYGSLTIPREREEEFRTLIQWLSDKKMAYNNGTLAENRIEQLQAIGIIWDTNQSSWENMYKQAQEYYNIHGDLLVPRIEEYKELANWIKWQRTKYKLEGGLSQEQIENLETIGMIWDVRQHQWNTMYAQAKAYYEEHGHLSFPSNGKYKKLNAWIRNKKSGYYGKGNCRLTKEQVVLLQAIEAIPHDTAEPEDSLEDLENQLQSLVKKKRQTSELVNDYEKLQEQVEQDKGVEK